MNQDLKKVPEEKEIRDAVFSINPDKAPGPDGMTSLFYQRFWSIIKDDIIKLVKEFFETGALEESLNETNICLIPKVDRPSQMSEFRPISLCNVSYKIISKILTARMKRFLPKLISETQSAFVARRLITDNILVAQEMFHALRTNQSCKDKFVAIKTDMSKAYDRVEWNFLEALLSKMGFDQDCVFLLMRCVRTVSYQILINGEAKGHIVPSRGLRQGDPLSPFLFIICTEVLISHIKEAERTKRIEGMKIARSCPPISHLLFADDSLFFCRTEQAQCEELMRIIDVYGYASGQQLNKSKSSVLFVTKVVASRKSDLKRSIGIQKEGGMGMYLGMPEQICGSKKEVFAYVRERLLNRTNAWSARLLSKGGKEVQIKSIAQAIPTYVMSCFLLPQEVTNKLSGAIAHFWWSSKNNQRGLHWAAWEKICVPLDEGGLGFRDFRDFNLALLAKQLWRLLVYPESLLARTLKGRYYRHSDPMKVEKSNNPSFSWRSMIAAKFILQDGLRKNIGNGADTWIWSDPWIHDTPPRPARQTDHAHDISLRVGHLIDHDTKQWNLPLINMLLTEEDALLIINMRISPNNRKDSFSWDHTKTGAYTVRAGYRTARAIRRKMTPQPIEEPSTLPLKAQVWKTKTPRKIQHLLWQALSVFLPTASRLVDRHCGADRVCQRCGAETETVNHIFFECPPAIQVWAISSIPSNPGTFPSLSLFCNIDYLMWQAREQGAVKQDLENFPWLFWYIWKARNSKVFEGKDVSPEYTVQLANHEAQAWRIAQCSQDVENEEMSNPPPSPDAVRDTDTRWRCRVDASWKMEVKTTGLGFVLMDGDNLILSESRGCSKRNSPLQAEFESLLWAMQAMQERHLYDIVFETDCKQLTGLIDKDDEWPALATEMDAFKSLRSEFRNFSLCFIPRSLNLHADSLAKGALARAELFSLVTQHSQQRLGNTSLLFSG